MLPMVKIHISYKIQIYNSIKVAKLINLKRKQFSCIHFRVQNPQMLPNGPQYDSKYKAKYN